MLNYFNAFVNDSESENIHDVFKQSAHQRKQHIPSLPPLAQFPGPTPPSTCHEGLLTSLPASTPRLSILPVAARIHFLKCRLDDEVAVSLTSPRQPGLACTSPTGNALRGPAGPGGAWTGPSSWPSGPCLPHDLILSQTPPKCHLQPLPNDCPTPPYTIHHTCHIKVRGDPRVHRREADDKHTPPTLQAVNHLNRYFYNKINTDLLCVSLRHAPPRASVDGGRTTEHLLFQHSYGFTSLKIMFSSLPLFQLWSL